MQSDARMLTKTRRRYTEAFKEEAVRLIRNSAPPVAQVARDLGVTDHLLYRWRAEQQQAESHGQTRQSILVFMGRAFRVDYAAQLKEGHLGGLRVSEETMAGIKIPKPKTDLLGSG